MHAQSNVARDLIMSRSVGIRIEPLVRITGVVPQHLDRKATLVAPSRAQLDLAVTALAELPCSPLHVVLARQVLAPALVFGAARHTDRFELQRK